MAKGETRTFGDLIIVELNNKSRKGDYVRIKVGNKTKYYKYQPGTTPEDYKNAARKGIFKKKVLGVIPEQRKLSSSKKDPRFDLNRIFKKGKSKAEIQNIISQSDTSINDVYKQLSIVTGKLSLFRYNP